MMPHSFVGLDVAVEHFLFFARTPFFVQSFIYITSLGSPVILTGIAAIALLISLFTPRFRAYAFAGINIFIGSAATSLLLKETIQRARPADVLPAITETGFSFPSGHATVSTTLYAFLAFAICSEYPKYTPQVTAATTVLLLLIGFSRLYLGVHFLSDVVGGYLLGSAWFFLGIWITRTYFRRT